MNKKINQPEKGGESVDKVGQLEKKRCLINKSWDESEDMVAMEINQYFT